MKNNTYGIIFDMDGTLIDVYQSYGLSTLETAYLYCEQIFGWKYLPDLENWFQFNHINDLKKLAGFNSDYHCSLALIDFLLSLIPDSNQRPIQKKSLPWDDQQFFSILPDFPVNLTSQWNNYLKKYKQQPDVLPIDIMTQSPWFALFQLDEDLLKTNYLIRIFQEIYYGQEKFQVFYGTKSKFATSDKYTSGFHSKEVLLIRKYLLDELNESNIPIGIITGRPRPDVTLGLIFFDLSPYFPPERIITLTDCIEHGQNPKPDPWSIHKLLERFPQRSTYYMIGDSPDDMKAAHLAGIQGIWYAGGRKISETPKEANKVLTDWTNLFEILR